MKFADLATKLGLSEYDLREFLGAENLGIDPETQTLSAKEVQMIKDAFGGEENTAEAYEEMIKEEQEREMRKQVKKKKGQSKNSTSRTKGKGGTSVKTDKEIIIGETTSVKELAEKTGIPVVKIIGDLMKNGVLATINQQIDYDTAVLVADEYGVKLSRQHSAAGAQDLVEGNLAALLKEEDPAKLQTRPPVVTIMGHVDHGKTSILDTIRKTKVAAGEHGGITQHIGAYQAESKGKLVTFLDTPGHEAFSEMRARGAQVTDVAVIVVAANEGIKPQTVESINHAKDAGVPVVVAINKMDIPGANPDRVKGEMAEHGLTSEDWGGETPMVPVSALKQTGIDDLIDTILLVAEMRDLKANPKRPAIATVIEAHLDPGFGPVATVVVNTGTLKIQDNFVAGETFGKAKSMVADTGKRLREAFPATPVQLSGFDQTPKVGDILQVTPDEKTARKRASEIGVIRSAAAGKQDGSGVGQIVAAIAQGKLKELKVILKADTKGSLEAIKASLEKIEHEEVTTRVIHGGVGQINESDVAMAEASGAVMLGFHVTANTMAEAKAEKLGIEILIYHVIYKLLDDVKKILSGLLEPEEVVVELGAMEVLAIFLSKKNEMVVGGKVVRGKAINHAKVRIRRDGQVIGEGEVRSLQREKDTVSEVMENKECGIRFSGSEKIEAGDSLEFYKVEKKIRTI